MSGLPGVGQSGSAPDLVPAASLLDLEGRVAVVTGAAKGIGLAIAERLLEAGASVVLTDVDIAHLDDVVPRHRPDRATTMQVDVGDPAASAAAAQYAVETFGGLHIWVNNAGIYPASAFDPLDAAPEEFERVLHVNTTGTYLGTQAAARHLGPGGVVLNMVSTAGFRGSGAYSASKWAVRGMTHGLASVLGPRGIRVVGIAPTLVETPGMEEFRTTDAGAGHDASYADKLPLGRLGTSDDIAKVALFLVSDAAGFITGVTIPVDGGRLAA